MRSLALLLSLLSVLLFFSSVASLSSFLLHSSTPKCLHVDATQDTIISIDYQAIGSDYVLDVNHPQHTPVYIAVKVTPKNRIIHKHHESPIQERLSPTNIMISERIGQVNHTMEVDGDATICIKAKAATAKKPLLLALSIKKSNPPLHILQHKVDQSQMDQHLTHMQVELERIQRGIQTILQQADEAVERDSHFHKQTKAMYAATTNWPIIQVCVLLMTGFTQASHIVRFFQSRRII